MLPPGITLYFVRHGETDWNAVRRYQGQTDTPLNDRGRSQAARNGQVLRQHLPSIADLQFIASPLSRTTETMRIIRRELGLPPDDFATDDRLKEINFGHWEACLWDELETTDAVEFQARLRNPYHWRPQGGESYADLSLRVGPFLDTIVRDALVVSHGGVSRVVRGRILGLPEAEIALLEVPQDRVLVLRRGHMEWL